MLEPREFLLSRFGCLASSAIPSPRDKLCFCGAGERGAEEGERGSGGRGGGKAVRRLVGALRDQPSSGLGSRCFKVNGVVVGLGTK